MEEREEFGAFIAGFVSGEGSFYVSFAKQAGPLPRGMKRQNYELWRKAVLMLHNQEHLTLDGVSQLRQIRAEMNKYRGQDEQLLTGPADQNADPGTGPRAD